MQKNDITPKKYDVLCLGRIVLDIYTYPITQKDTKGNFYIADHLNCFIGGTAANTAFILSKLGASTALNGAVGSDIWGSTLIKMLKKYKLYNGNIYKLNTQTSVSFITHINNSEPTFTHIEGANRCFAPSDATLNILKRSRHMHIGGVFLLPEFDNGNAKGLINFSKEHGVKVSIDTTHNLLKPNSLKNYNWTDLVFMNYEEASIITGTKSIKKMRDFFVSNYDFETVVIKLGKRGCAVLSADKYTLYEGFKITSIDVCGAGDAFVAGFLFGVINGWGENKTATFANACGAQACLFIGATNEAFTKEKVFTSFMLKKTKNSIVQK